MGIQDAYTGLMYRLFELYDDREAAHIADWITEHITGFRKIERIIHKEFLLSNTQVQQFRVYTEQLMQHIPVQYVLQEAWFAGLQLYVDENVLIPRPETEELVEWIIAESKTPDMQGELHPTKNRKLLDIGTGSGCIAVALKKKLPAWEIYACDISEKALAVAEKNAQQYATKINFDRVDILDKAQWQLLGKFDIMVSNPPYIKQSEAAHMPDNVLLHEPHLALFVEDEDPLLFYKTIADVGLTNLHPDGKLFFEINEILGKDVLQLLEAKGYKKTVLKKDMQGKERMVMAVSPAAIKV